MSKLKVKQVLAETNISTNKYGVNVKIVPIKETEVEIQFGHYEPASQIAAAPDLRELAGIFVEVAELLEGGKKAQEKMAEPEEGGREVHVKLSSSAGTSTLHGVFSGLTDKQVEGLQHAILVMDGALPYGMQLWVMD